MPEAPGRSLSRSGYMVTSVWGGVGGTGAPIVLQRGRAPAELFPPSDNSELLECHESDLHMRPPSPGPS